MTEAAKPGCVYCGAAPAPHAVLLIDTTITIFFGRMLRILAFPILVLLTPLVVRLTNVLTHAVLGIFSAFGAVEFGTTYEPDHLDRKAVIFAEAKKRGIHMETIRVLKKNMAQTRAMLPLSKGATSYRWWYFEHIPIPPWLEPSAAREIDNKEEFKKIFRKDGLRVPYGKPVLTFWGAKQVLKKVGGPVIVKPLEGSRARHTTVGVTTEAELKEAVRIARMICPMLMIEECVEGVVHRATCIGGTLEGVIKFVRPSMMADGVRTAKELREAWNTSLSYADVEPVASNAVFLTTLAHQGYTPESIPPKGSLLTLAEFSERANGGYNEDLTDQIPTATRDYIEKAARAVQVSVVGFDLISRDLTNSAEPITFLEANTAPFIEIHHAPSKGTPRDVAAKVLDLWFTRETI